MALVLTSKNRTARLVFSGDPAVPAAVADRSIKAWVPVDSVAGGAAGATVAEVRALSWLEWTEVEALAPDRQVVRVVELGLVSFDGDRAAVAVFLADPPAELVVPLYRAISDLTWGN